MNLADARLKELDSASLTADERTLLRCRVAADLIHKGQYEAAREALGELWRGIGERPEMERLPPAVAAEVLLQCGPHGLAWQRAEYRRFAGESERLTHGSPSYFSGSRPRGKGCGGTV